MKDLDYPVGARVKLERSYDGCASGSVGVVVGFYRTDPPAYSVRIAERWLRIPPECLAPVDEGA